MSHYETDTVIIGAGPTGLFAAFQAGMLTLSCHVIDALDAIGGQCTALYPEKPIYDIPAYPAIDAGDLIHQLEKQAAPFNPVYHLGQQVDSITQQADGRWQLITSKQKTFITKTIIIAAGAGAFGPNRPPLDNIEAYEGTSIFYTVQKRDQFTGKHVVIAGGGDSAVDWALLLAENAARVSVVHRRAKFRAAPDSEAKLNALAAADKLDLITPYQLSGLQGANGQIQQVVCSDLDGNTKTIQADILLPFFGLAMDLGPIAQWGLNLDKNFITIDPTTCQTNQPGIFAIGDIAHYPNKLKLILCGFSEAALALHAARSHIYPNQNFHFEYSTSKGAPGEDKHAA